jgi:hypothetical protein
VIVALRLEGEQRLGRLDAHLHHVPTQRPGDRGAVDPPSRTGPTLRSLSIAESRGVV